MNIENFSNKGINGVVNQFQSATSGWMTTADHVALHIFGLLAVIEFVWAGITLLLRKNDLNDMIVGVLMKVVSLAFFYTLIIEAPVWVPDIIQSFWQAGGQISGQPVMSPNAIMLNGVELGANLINAAMKVVSGWHLGASIALIAAVGLAAILILVGTVITALQLVVALIEAFIVVGGGAMMLGALGSRWTTSWGEKYFGYAVSIGVKLLAVELIVGLANSLASQWNVEVANLSLSINNVYPSIAQIFTIGMEITIMGGLAIMIPSIASSLMNGSPNLSAGQMGAAGAAVVGGTVAMGAGAAMAGASLANSAIGAGKGLGSLAASAHKAGGGFKGLQAAFQEGAGAAGESGILGLGGAGASAGSQAAARMVGGLSNAAGLAGRSAGTAGMHGLKAAGGMAWDKVQGVSGRRAQTISNSLGDKAVQGHGENTAGGDFANRIRAQRQGEDPKGNSVGLGPVPNDPSGKVTSGPLPESSGPGGAGGAAGTTGGTGGTGPSTATDPNAGASMGSTTSAGNREGATAAGIPGERLGNTAAGIQNKPGGDGFTGGGGSGNNSLAGQGHGPRFDTRPDHQKAIDSFQAIKEQFKPRGIPHEGGHGSAGGPRINHSE